MKRQRLFWKAITTREAPPETGIDFYKHRYRLISMHFGWLYNDRYMYRPIGSVKDAVHGGLQHFSFSIYCDTFIYLVVSYIV